MKYESVCQFGNKRCLCQSCLEPCNNGFNCSHCDQENKAVHDIYMCTGYVGLERLEDDWFSGLSRNEKGG